MKSETARDTRKSVVGVSAQLPATAWRTFKETVQSGEQCLKGIDSPAKIGLKGSVSRKLRPRLLYVHHLKALPLRIGRGPFSQSFIKGMSRNLRLKSSVFSEHFPLILLFILKKLGSPRSGL